MAIPSKYKIARYWAFQPLTDPLVPFVDIGEPTCMGCEYFEPGWDIDEGEVAEVAFHECWERASLERAHIVARSQGGSDEVRNFVLLCADCHAEAPMVTDRKYMLQWLRTRETIWQKFFRSIAEAAKAYEIDSVEFGLHDDSEIKQAVEKARGEISIGSHFGKGESMASYMVVIARACLILKEWRLDALLVEQRTESSAEAPAPK